MTPTVQGALTLYVEAYWCSPFDFTCFVALREKGLEFTSSRAIVHSGQPLPAAYRDRTWTGRVPALAHDDFWLSESTAVVEYLEEAFPPPAYPALLPGDVRGRGRARQLMSFLRSELDDLRRDRPSWLIVYPGAPPPLTPAARRDADALVALAERLLAAGELPGGAMTSADLAFALLRLVRAGDPVPEPVRRFVDEVCARPAVRDFLEHPRPPNPPQS